ncbi:MAG: NAD(P)H-hydrate dehydratase, partial [Gemmatimonadota bacterium]
MGSDVFGRARVPLLTAAQAASADRAAHDAGIPERVLMENAGRAAALVLDRLHPRGSIVGVAGSGNNGGDLLVMLRVLHTWGRDAAVIAAGSAPPDPSLLHGFDLAITDADDARARLILAGADVLVDGMLGTGSAGAPRGRVAAWIDLLNASPRAVCALDLPSGVDATSGAVTGTAVRADLTVTFGWPKIGLLLQPARQHCGRLVAVEIGFAPFDENRIEGPLAFAVTPGMVRDRLRTRAADAHKGSAGRLLILAGSTGMSGAAALTADAALRAGAGLLRIASASENRVILQTLVPEATFLDAAALEADDLAAMHALVAGPGLGTKDDARAALQRALDMTAGRPTLLDADALNMLAEQSGALRGIGDDRALVVTPHAKELSRLTGDSVESILADAPAAARAAADAFHCVVVLKWQPTLVAAPGGTLLVNTVGSSDAATAGMGDQLAGTIGALLVG